MTITEAKVQVENLLGLIDGESFKPDTDEYRICLWMGDSLSPNVGVRVSTVEHSRCLKNGVRYHINFADQSDPDSGIAMCAATERMILALADGWDVSDTRNAFWVLACRWLRLDDDNPNPYRDEEYAKALTLRVYPIDRFTELPWGGYASPNSVSGNRLAWRCNKCSASEEAQGRPALAITYTPSYGYPPWCVLCGERMEGVDSQCKDCE